MSLVRNYLYPIRIFLETRTCVNCLLHVTQICIVNYVRARFVLRSSFDFAFSAIVGAICSDSPEE